MLGVILQKFSEKSPVTVMVHGLLERLLAKEKIDEWFNTNCQVQYTRHILFSSLVYFHTAGYKPSPLGGIRL